MIVGSGLYGAVCAEKLTEKGYKCLVVERRAHVGGNVYTEKICGINVHVYGAHIFHTSDSEVWDYLNCFAKFNDFVNRPVARYKDEEYPLPFNMNTFCKLWKDVKTPDDARKKIQSERGREFIDSPRNLEEQAINLVGRTLYEKLIRGYTEKQWGKPCNKLPPSIINRIPVRFTFDNNYFDDTYQGVPVGGYTPLIERLLRGSDVKLCCDFLKERESLFSLAENIIYTGAVDEFYGCRLGELEYRSVRFETEVLNTPDFQSNAVVNYTSADVPYTRIIEHKHFERCDSKNTVISREYPFLKGAGDEPYYPVADKKNLELYGRYARLAAKEKNTFFGGRLGSYKYLDMDETVRAALDFVKNIK